MPGEPAASSAAGPGKRTRTQGLQGPARPDPAQGSKSPPLKAPPGLIPPQVQQRGKRGADSGGTGGPGDHHDHDDHHDQGAGAPHHGANDIQIETAAEAAGAPGHSRRNVGCGEHVTFSAAQGGTWTATAGTPVTGSGTSFVWTAPAVGGSATITLDRGNGQHTSVDMTVVAPQSITFRKRYDLPQTPAGAGMRTNLTFNPTTVSFANLEWRENGDGAAAAPQNVTGYFETHRAVHAAPLVHHPFEQWLPMGANNAEVDDTAHIRDLPPINPQGTNTGYYGGHFEWHIPNEYRVAGSNEVHPITTVTQSFDMADGDAAGDVTISKGGQSATQAMTGHAVGGNLQAFADLAAARERVIDNGGSAGSRKDMLKVSLSQLVNLRNRGDLASARLLAEAIREQAFQLYVFLECMHTANRWGADEVVITIHGHRPHALPSRSMNDAGGTRTHPFNILLDDIFDWATFNNNAIGFHVNVGGQDHVARLDWPWENFASRVDLNPVDGGHYRVSAFIASADQEGRTE